MVTPAARREAVAHLRTTFGVSERRACEVLGADRTSVRYRCRRADDAVVRARLRELAAIRRRFGYRRYAVEAVIDERQQIAEQPDEQFHGQHHDTRDRSEKH